MLKYYVLEMALRHAILQNPFQFSVQYELLCSTIKFRQNENSVESVFDKSEPAPFLLLLLIHLRYIWEWDIQRYTSIWWRQWSRCFIKCQLFWVIPSFVVVWGVAMGISISITWCCTAAATYFLTSFTLIYSPYLEERL